MGSLKKSLIKLLIRVPKNYKTLQGLATFIRENKELLCSPYAGSIYKMNGAVKIPHNEVLFNLKAENIIGLFYDDFSQNVMEATNSQIEKVKKHFETELKRPIPIFNRGRIAQFLTT